MPRAKHHHAWQFLRSLCLLFILAAPLCAQDPDKTEKKVSNPIGAAEAQRKAEGQIPADQVRITANIGPTPTDVININARKVEEQDKVLVYTGEVEGYYRGRRGELSIFADRVTYNEATADLVAEGNVYFEQGEEKFVGERLEFNLKTELGVIFNTTGFTSRTRGGTVVTIDADRADKIDEDTFSLDNAKVTACNDRVPKWAFTAKRARIRLDHRAKVYNALFRIKGVPILYMPYASISISKKDRSSGFLIPSSGSSNIKGRTVHLAYYQTLGRSADILFRTDVFSKRGVGFGFDFRARTNETSHIAVGSFVVLDRLLGQKKDGAGNPLPDQGGSSFYVDGVHNFKNGFTAVADVNITSSFAFRQVFGENVLSAISPEERSIFYLNRNWQAYSFNALFGEQSFFIGRKINGVTDDQIVKVRQFPDVELSKRSTKISDSFSVYFSFDSSLGGVRRSETKGDQTLFKTPSVVQRLDFFPRFTFPLKSFAGFTLTPSIGLRSTFYSDSVDPVQRQVTGTNLFRNYADIDLDLRAPALAKVFHHKDGTPWFKHIIEPYAEYRRIEGIDDFDRTIRTDERDAIADTNEIEYGITNRFYVKRPSKDGGSTQPHEWLDLTLVQKYFFDPTFGGALKTCTRAEYEANNCTRNQFFPLTTLTGFSYAGVERNVSPLSLRARLRPNDQVSADVRLNYDTRYHDLRDVVLGSTWSKSLLSLPISVSQNWYYTRHVAVDKFREETVFDPSTLPGNQFDFSGFVGNPARGPYGGFTMVYDLRDQEFSGIARDRRLIALTSSVGWAWDCCSLQVQSFTFNAGLRNETRYIFAFTLKGIGTFGTENIGQRRR